MPDRHAGDGINGSPLTILYIAGSDRSGTTLLDRIIGAGRDAFSGGEIHQIFQRGIIGNELCSCSKPFDRCTVWRATAERSRLLGQQDIAGELEASKQSIVRIRNLRTLARGSAMVAGRDPAPLRDRLGRVYRAIARVTGARVIVDSSKHPALPFLMREDRGLDIRVVHVVRDSRGVVNSWSRRKRRIEAAGRDEYLDRPGLMRSCYLWNVAHLGCETLREAFPYVRLRYEDAVANLQDALGRVAALAGLPRGAWDDVVDGETLHLSGLHTLAGNPMRLDGDTVRLRLDDAWRSELSASRRTLISLLTLPGLVRYGYM